MSNMRGAVLIIAGLVPFLLATVAILAIYVENQPAGQTGKKNATLASILGWGFFLYAAYTLWHSLPFWVGLANPMLQIDRGIFFHLYVLKIYGPQALMLASAVALLLMHRSAPFLFMALFAYSLALACWYRVPILLFHIKSVPNPIAIITPMAKLALYGLIIWYAWIVRKKGRLIEFRRNDINS